MKAKKVLAMLMASAMIMGTSVTAFAAVGEPATRTEKGTETAKIPTKEDTHNVTVKNVEKGMTVTAYQIVEAMYNTKGFYGYQPVEALTEEGLTIKKETAPTAEEVFDIVAAITKQDSTLTLKSTKLAWNETNKTYEALLNPGYWVIVVDSGVSASLKVYNPMLAGVYYSESGSENTMTSDPVDATKEWTLVSTETVAKSDEITFVKSADKETVNKGDEVGFTLETKVPAYSKDAYNAATFIIEDTMTGLTLDTTSITVNGKTGDELDGMCTVEAQDTALTITFESDWILDNGGSDVVVTYTATATGDQVNEDPFKNSASLTYTNSPEGSTSGKTDYETVYTFDIDGDVTGHILKKVAYNTQTKENEALAGAEFTLYKDKACTEQYFNDAHKDDEATEEVEATVTSNDEGKLYITGLAAGTYYLKETKAPNGYSLNNTVYEIVIDANIDGDVLESWEISVKDLSDEANEAVKNTFKVDQGTADSEGDKNTTEIMNTKIAELPSTGGIGTTIFTIGGCAIMVTAAGLFFATRRKVER